jgi:hypothetical protein
MRAYARRTREIDRMISRLLRAWAIDPKGGRDAAGPTRHFSARLGLRLDGKKEIIDSHLTESESQAEWAQTHRGLTGRGRDMICVEGGSVLAAPHEDEPRRQGRLPQMRLRSPRISTLTDP